MEPLGWLGSWKGFLRADAYAGYHKLYARGDVTEVACWAHTRRKYFDAQESDTARSLWMCGRPPKLLIPSCHNGARHRQMNNVLGRTDTPYRGVV